MKRMSTKTRRTLELVGRGVVPMIALGILAIVIATIQTGFVWSRYKKLGDAAMEIAEQRMSKDKSESENDWTTFHSYAQARVDLIAYMLENRSDADGADLPLADVANEFELDELYYVSASGRATSATGSKLPDNIDAAFAEDNGHAYAQIGDMCYYYAEYGRGRIVAGENIADMVEAEDELTSVANALHDIHVGINGYLCALKPTNGNFVIAYAPDDCAIGESGTLLVTGDSDSVISENGSVVELNGTRYFLTYHYEADDYYLLIAIVPETELAGIIRTPVILAMAMFAAIALLMLAYMRYIGEDIRSGRMVEAPHIIRIGRNYHMNVAIFEKTRILMTLGLLSIMAITFYCQALVLLDHEKNIDRVELDTVSQELLEDTGSEEQVSSVFDDEYTKLAKEIAYTFKLNPALVNNSALSEIAHITGVNTIFVFNSEGATEATSTVYVDMTVDTDQTEFWNVLKGYTETVIRHPENDGDLEYIGVNRLDANGMVQVGMSTDAMLERMSDYRLNTVLNRLSSEKDNKFYFAIDKETGCYLAWPQTRMVGTDASGLELSSSSLDSVSLSYLNIDGSNYLVYGSDMSSSGSNYFIYGKDISTSTEGLFGSDLGSGEITLYCASSSGPVLKQSAIVGGIVTAESLLVILILMLMMIVRRNGDDENEAAQEAAAAAAAAGSSAYYAAQMGNRSQTTQSAASRWDGTRIRWRDRTAESKIEYISKRIIVLAVIALMGAVYSNLADSLSIFSFIISKKWQHTLNLFSISYVILLFVQVSVIAAVLRWIVRLFTFNRGSRSETVGRLLDNFLRYAAVIFLLFYSMQFIGIHTTAILASAGLLSLALSLGAQSLVADVFAGIFIVFEGEFRVGDIVTIDGYRGTVQEIGIRTTKVESGGRDIKIYRNSQISGVINMTKQYSAAVVSFDIDYRESIERVERVLREELPKLREKYPQCIDDPVCLGVDSLGSSGVTMKVVVHCLEKDRLGVMRALNRELKLICDRNHICIPFPQVVVNAGSPDPDTFIHEDEETQEQSEPQPMPEEPYEEEDTEAHKHGEEDEDEK